VTAGLTALEALGDADRAFLGADAVNAESGICEAEQEQTRLEELMRQRAHTMYVLAHAENLGSRPFHAWAPIPAGATLVTDSGVTEEQVRCFAKASINVAVAPDMPRVPDNAF
jgi:DeoR/GlpR family transcriptional regulator of sugar metabolism